MTGTGKNSKTSKARGSQKELSADELDGASGGAGGLQQLVAYGAQSVYGGPPAKTFVTVKTKGKK